MSFIILALMGKTLSLQKIYVLWIMLKCGKSFPRYVPPALRCLVKASWIYFGDATGNKSGVGWPRLAVRHRSYFIFVFIVPTGPLTYYLNDLSSR